MGPCEMTLTGWTSFSCHKMNPQEILAQIILCCQVLGSLGRVGWVEGVRHLLPAELRVIFLERKLTGEPPDIILEVIKCDFKATFQGDDAGTSRQGLKALV